MDYKHTLKNYKCIDSYEADVQNANLVIFTAKNHKGKTSIATSIKEMISAKKLTPDPLKKGEKEGMMYGLLPDKDNNLVSISVLIDSEGKYAFTLIDNKGKKITQPTKIREVMGISTFMTIDDFFKKCQNAKGKREILEDLIYKLLPEDERLEVLKIDKQLTTDSELYKTIHNTKKELEEISIKKQAIALTDDEKLILNSNGNIEIKLNEKLDLISQYDNFSINVVNYNNKLQENERIKNECIIAKERLEQWKVNKKTEIENAYKKALADLEIEYNSTVSEIKTKEENIVVPEKVEASLTEEQYKLLKEEVDILQQAKYKEEAVKEKAQKLKDFELSIAPKQKLLLDKENEKTAIKNKKLDILKKVDIPELTFDDDTFYINGLEVSDTQISESKLGLILVELLCKQELNETPIIFVGNMRVFDKDNARKVIEICQKHNKTAFFELVSNTDDIRVITEINDVY